MVSETGVEWSGTHGSTLSVFDYSCSLRGRGHESRRTTDPVFEERHGEVHS